MDCSHRRTYRVHINVETNGKYATITWQDKCKNCGAWAGDPYPILYKEDRI